MVHNCLGDQFIQGIPYLHSYTGVDCSIQFYFVFGNVVGVGGELVMNVTIYLNFVRFCVSHQCLAHRFIHTVALSLAGHTYTILNLYWT